MSEATSLREEQVAAFAALKGDFDATILQINGTIAALEKGIAGSFLQTSGAQVLQKLILAKAAMYDIDWQEVISFLSNGQNSGHIPRSGKITGILKELGDEMSKDLTSATNGETSRNKGFCINETIPSSKDI